MKKLFVFVCMMLFLHNIVFAEQKPIGLKSVKQQNEQVPITRSIIINITGFYDTETDKATLYFHQSIGNATVSLTDEAGSIIYSCIVNTETTDILEFSLPANFTNKYKIRISSENFEAIGYFN